MNFQSRKFILTLVYTAIFLANYVFKLGIPWEAMLSLAGMFGIYNVANAVSNSAYAKADAQVVTATLYNESVPETAIDYDALALLVAEAQCEMLDMEEEEKQQEADAYIKAANA